MLKVYTKKAKPVSLALSQTYRQQTNTEIAATIFVLAKNNIEMLQWFKTSNWGYRYGKIIQKFLDFYVLKLSKCWNAEVVFQ